MLVALVLVGLATLGTTAWVFDSTRSTAAEVQDHAVPSIAHVMAVRASLIEADAAAVESFRTGEVRLTGPGERYQNAIAIASQSLTQLAQDSIAGESAAQSIQLVQGLVVSYVAFIEQADAHFREDAGSVVGLADLWYASDTLHNSVTGILHHLQDLLTLETAALREKADAPHFPGFWMVPLLVLIGLLIVVQFRLGRHFRRTINIPLVLATLAAIGLGVVMLSDFAARGKLDDARAGSALSAERWQQRMSVTDNEGQTKLSDLVHAKCATCTVTVPPGTADPPSEPSVTGANRDAEADAGQAADSGGIQLLAALLALLAVALVPVGLYPRLDEYR